MYCEIRQVRKEATVSGYSVCRSAAGSPEGLAIKKMRYTLYVIWIMIIVIHSVINYFACFVIPACRESFFQKGCRTSRHDRLFENFILWCAIIYVVKYSL